MRNFLSMFMIVFALLALLAAPAQACNVGGAIGTNFVANVDPGYGVSPAFGVNAFASPFVGFNRGFGVNVAVGGLHGGFGGHAGGVVRFRTRRW